VVAATDRYIAEDALELIDVEYEPLEPVVDARKAGLESSPNVLEGKDSNVAYDRRFVFGDAEAAFASADLIVREQFRWHRSSGNPIETCVCIADWNPFTGMLTLRGGHRSPHLILPALVISLGIPSQHVRIIQSPLGGSFGVKTFARYVVLISLMAKKLGGRTVKWTEDRIEHLVGNSSHAWDRHYDCELALKRDGTITGMKKQLRDDLGAFSEWLAIGMLLKPLLCLGSCYPSPTSTIPAKRHYQQNAPGPLRLFGLPRAAGSSAADRQGRQKLGLGNEIRRRNFIKEQFPYVSYPAMFTTAATTRLVSIAVGEIRLRSTRREQQVARSRSAAGYRCRQQPAGAHWTADAGGYRRAFSAASSPEGILLRRWLQQNHRGLGFPPEMEPT
jgi:xanthine dehydrogenase molybdopterin-binding subunit B